MSIRSKGNQGNVRNERNNTYMYMYTSWRVANNRTKRKQKTTETFKNVCHYITLMIYRDKS